MNQIQQVNNLVPVSVNQLLSKASSKKEIFNFFALECEAYLPKADTINIYFLKQIMTSQKDYIRRSAVKVAIVPQIEGLTVDDFLDYAQAKPALLRYLPDPSGWNHIDKKWLCDVLYTLDPEGIQGKINQAVIERKERLEMQQDLLLSMRPEFAKALQNSLMFSQSKGKSAFLLKDSSKNKRKRIDLEEVKEEETQLKQDKQMFLLNHKRLKQEHMDVQQQMINLQKSQSLVENLFNQGYIDESGDPTGRVMQPEKVTSVPNLPFFNNFFLPIFVREKIFLNSQQSLIQLFFIPSIKIQLHTVHIFSLKSFLFIDIQLQDDSSAEVKPLNASKSKQNQDQFSHQLFNYNAQVSSEMFPSRGKAYHQQQVLVLSLWKFSKLYVQFQ